MSAAKDDCAVPFATCVALLVTFKLSGDESNDEKSSLSPDKKRWYLCDWGKVESLFELVCPCSLEVLDVTVSFFCCNEVSLLSFTFLSTAPIILGNASLPCLPNLLLIEEHPLSKLVVFCR